jgi:hypothetical protein
VSLVREIVDLHRRQLFGLIEIRGVGRMRRLFAESRLELQDKLRAVVRAGRGKTFTAHHLRLVLAQVSDSAAGFEADLGEHLARTGRTAAVLAPRHLTDMVSRMEARYGAHVTPVVQARQAAVVAGAHRDVMPSLLDRYRTSVRTWGRPTIARIREQLARSIVQGEGVDEATRRVSDAGGLYEGERWRAERIVRTELSYSYGAAKQRSMESLRTQVPKLQKRLVATFDDRTGEDSKELNGQTVEVHQPFLWHVKDSKGHPTGKVVRYMQPPNRPNDREVVVPWQEGWGSGGLARPGDVEPSTAGLPEA